jgi:hypothetical protein
LRRYFDATSSSIQGEPPRRTSPAIQLTRAQILKPHVCSCSQAPDERLFTVSSPSAQGSPRTKRTRLQGVTRPPACLGCRDPRRHQWRAGELRPPLHTISFLASLLDADRLPLCLRSVLGRIWESKNFSQIDVESASRACDRRRGRARAREAAARRCGRSVFFAARHCPARKSPMHALCRCTCVSSRVPLEGISYLYYYYFECTGSSAR